MMKYTLAASKRTSRSAPTKKRRFMVAECTFLLDGEPFAYHSHLQEIVDMSSGVLVAAVAGSLALATTIGVAAPLSRQAPPQKVQQPSVPQGDPVAGISCDAMEGMKIHIHQHLVLLDHGKPIVIPNNVGRP